MVCCMASHHPFALAAPGHRRRSNQAQHFARNTYAELRRLIYSGVFPDAGAAALLCELVDLVAPYSTPHMAKRDERARRHNMRDSYSRLVLGQLARLESEEAFEPEEAEIIRDALAAAVQLANNRDREREAIEAAHESF